MRNFILGFMLLFSQTGLYAEEDSNDFLEQDIEQLSFYMGYIIGRDHVKQSYGFPYRFGKVVEGMRAGVAGEAIEGKEELVPLIKRLQKNIVEKQSMLNLQEAEHYLVNLKGKMGIIELEPLKLYYLTEQVGQGPYIGKLPRLHLRMSELKDGTLHTIYSTYDVGASLELDLDCTVPGFQKGIAGMRVGEKRTIYVHPSLAFGIGKLDIQPNRLIVFEVLACDENSTISRS